MRNMYDIAQTTSMTTYIQHKGCTMGHTWCVYIVFIVTYKCYVNHCDYIYISQNVWIYINTHTHLIHIYIYIYKGREMQHSIRIYIIHMCVYKYMHVIHIALYVYIYIIGYHNNNSIHVYHWSYEYAQHT